MSLIDAATMPTWPASIASTSDQARLADAGERAVVDDVGRPEPQLLALLQRAGDHAHEHDDAAKRVVPAVEDQRRHRRVAIGDRRRDARDDGLEHLFDADAGLRRDQQRVGGVEADRVLDLLLDPIGARDRQIDLVQDRHDRQVVVERDVDVRERLRLDALRGIDDEQGTLRTRRASARLRSGSRRGPACLSVGTDRRAHPSLCNGAGPTAP